MSDKSSAAGSRKRPWDDPKAFALSVTGAVLVVLGLTVADSVPVTAIGAAVAVAGFVVSRRQR